MQKVLIRQTGECEVLELVREPDQRPGAGEVTVRTHAAAVGWPDIIVRRGRYPWMPPLPATLGFELSGRIEEVGTGVSSLMVGQPVYLSSYESGYSLGCYTDLACVSASAVRVLPEEFDLDQAANLGYVALAWALLNDIGLRRSPRSVLVMGAAGGTGVCIVQIARTMGAQVIASVGSDTKVDLVRSLGAEHVVNHKSENLAERVKDLTGGRGVDVVLNHIAGSTLLSSLDMLAEWGTLCIYGAVGGPSKGQMAQVQQAGFGKCARIQFFSMHGYEEDADGRARILEAAVDLMSKGGVRMPIAARFPLSEAGEAHRLLESGTTCGRILLVP